MALIQAEIDICNQAYDRIGSDRFTLAQQTAGTNLKSIKANLHYAQTRDALLRRFPWSFAVKRKRLASVTGTPDFGDYYRFKLPDDYWRLWKDDSIDDSTYINDRPTIESGYYLSQESEVDLIYVRKVTDPAEFDPLFIEVLILRLAKKFRPAIAGTKTPALYQEIDKDLIEAERTARNICRAETNVSGRSDWNQARSTATVDTAVTDGETRS